jgi:hypothetical protein
MTPQLYTIEKAAAILDVHPQQVRELMTTHQLEFIDVSVGMATRTGRVSKATGKPPAPRPRPRIPDYALEKFIKARSSKTRRTAAA